MPFLSGYKKFELPIIDSNGNPAWPEMFPLDKIEKLRESVGNRHFSAQMMLRYVPLERIRLDPGAINIYSGDFDTKYAKIGDFIITGASVYWDPSIGHRSSDGSVCVLIYRDDKNRKIFLHDIMYMVVSDEQTHPLHYQCNEVLDFLSRHNQRRLSVEINGIGNALPEILQDEISKRGGGFFVNKIVNHANKETRILDAIEPLLSSGRLYARNIIANTPFFSEMLGWVPTGGGQDDGLDALAGAICANACPVRPRNASNITFSANTNFKI